jgi:hypothetical protein
MFGALLAHGQEYNNCIEGFRQFIQLLWASTARNMLDLVVYVIQGYSK